MSTHTAKEETMQALATAMATATATANLRLRRRGQTRSDHGRASAD